MKTLLKKTLRIESIIIAASLLVICLNSFYSLANVMIKINSKQPKLIEPGTQFILFKEHLKDIEEAGYITNRNMSEEGNDGTFLQAQYMLAPTILRLNEKNHHFVIVDQTSLFYTAYTLRELKNKILASSPYGPVLTEKQ